MNQIEKKIIDVVKVLLDKNKTISTLEIKNQCRKLYPKDTFNQNDVSKIMNDIAMKNVKGLQYVDNGTYREYYVTKNPVNIISLTKKEMVKLLRQNVGKFFGITFIKKDGSKRTLNCHMNDKNFINDLGYLNVITNKNEYKQVLPTNILEISINGNKYINK